MTTRNELIARLAHGIREAYAGDWTPEVIRAENERGWLIEIPAQQGSIIRHDGVIFTPDEIERLLLAVAADA